MADFDNIKLDIPVFTHVDDYFFTIYGSPLNLLMKKTNYGDPVMTYPLSHEISPGGGNFIGLEYDGSNFWSLEKVDYGGSLDKRRRLRRWRVENHMCVLKDSWILSGQAGENINTDVFTVEHYHDVLASPAGPSYSSQTITLSTPTACFFHSGDSITLYDPSTGAISII